MAVQHATLVHALDHLKKENERGFRFIGTDGQERYYPYAELHREALVRAAHLQALGLRKGDRLALVVPEGHEFVINFLGAAVAGVVPVPIFPRATFKAIEGYVDTVAHIVGTSGARVLLTMEATRPFVEQVLERNVGLERVLTTETAFSDEPPPLERPELGAEDLCFLQFTSGSTSRPKGVMVTHGNLVANATAFLGPNGADRRDDDIGVTWLPLFHDMGLIGFVLGTLICDVPVVFLPTASFARTPRLWLETIHRFRGTITYAPNFAYSLLVKRLKDRDVEALDLSCVRVAGCGAEPIRAQTLRDFSQRLAPAGFNPNALLASYGMAEATLAITFHPVSTPMVTDTVDLNQLNVGNAQPPRARETKKTAELVSCGVPFPGHEVRVVDEAGNALGPRQVGEVITRGPSVCPGYFQNAEATAESWKNGWLHTGDLGYFADGNLYICGRLKDLIIIRGANYYPSDIEWLVGDLPGVRRGHVVAFGVSRDGEEHLVVAAEAASGDAPALRQAIVSRVYEGTGLQVNHVAVVPLGALPQTSSGKPQRRKTKQMYEEGQLPEHPATVAGDRAENTSGA